MGARHLRALANIPETVWQEACRREAVVRPLATGPRLSRQAVLDACARLRLGKSQVYELLRRYRIDPRTTSLVPGAGGMPKGADRLAPEIAAIIEGCIERFYLTRQKLSGAALFDAVEQDCRKADLKPPSLNAVRRRVAAKPVPDVVRAREGAAVATQRFRPVSGSLKTSWPPDVLQMDHTPMDVMVVDEIARKPIGRPWLTLALDVDSRMVAGFLISLDPPCAMICAGTPEARQAMLTDPQLRSRFLDIELPLWRDDGDLRVFLARLVQSLPLRRPSPVDSPGLRRLIAMRSAGLTWTICKAFERAAVAAIASGEERLDRSGLESPAVWRGLAAPGTTVRRGRGRAAAAPS